MKKNFYLFAKMFTLFILLYSCTMPGGRSKHSRKNKNPISTGKISFAVGSANNSTKSLMNSSLEVNVLPKFILVTVKNKSNGNTVLNREKMELFSSGSEYISSAISLDTGSYELSEYLVVDDSNNVIYLTPVGGSPDAYLVENPLPLDFLITSGNITTIRPEVVKVDGPLSDYGYVSFTFDIKENLFKNGNFCNGYDNWFLLKNDTGDGTIAMENGQLKVDIINGSGIRHGIGIGQLNVSLEYGCTYELSFDARSDIQREVTVLTQLQGDPWTRYNDGLININTDMQKYTYTFTMLNPTDKTAGFQIHFGNTGNGAVYFDNIILRKISQNSSGYIPPAQSNPSDFVRANMRNLVVGSGGTQIHLRGVAFGNNVWQYVQVPLSHHNEQDFARLKTMGANAIRFYLNYCTLEDDSNPYHYKKSGWDWIDQNIVWAKKYGIYLILNIHVPQGGYQSNGEGMALWDNAENQNRLTALWKKITERYANEPAIAGYDLVNEPFTSKSVDQWKTLAQRLTDNIRAVDANHLVIIEELLGAKEVASSFGNPAYTLFKVNDANVMYDFHFYYPIDYALQNAQWTNYGEGGVYPDYTKCTFPTDLEWYCGYFDNPYLNNNLTSWTYLEGNKVKMDDQNIVQARPVLYAERIQNAAVYFDEIVINEYDENQVFTRQLMIHDIELGDQWNQWSANGSGFNGISFTQAHSGSSSFYVTGTTDNASYSNFALRFKPRAGHYYSVNGWVKGENLPQDAKVKLQFECEKSTSGAKSYSRDKDYLESIIKKYVKFGIDNNVPMNIGEFGLYRNCFNDGRNGLQWVTDAQTLFNQYNLNYTYHAYHESSLGIYYNDQGLPDPGKCNYSLIDVLKNNFGN